MEKVLPIVAEKWNGFPLKAVQTARFFQLKGYFILVENLGAAEHFFRKKLRLVSGFSMSGKKLFLKIYLCIYQGSLQVSWLKTLELPLPLFWFKITVDSLAE